MLAKTFPKSSGEFDTSLAADLLPRFAYYFWFLNLRLPGADKYNRTVQLAPQVFDALSAATFVDFADNIQASTGDLEIDLDFAGINLKHRSQKHKKAATRARVTPIDRTLFEKLGVIVPESVLAAEEVVHALLENLQAAMQVSAINPATRYRDVTNT